MSRTILPPKYVGETVAAIFDFSFVLVTNPTAATITPVVTMAVFSGVDASPSTMAPANKLTSSGLVAAQQINGGVAGVLYVVQCTATLNTGPIYTLSAYLSVLPSLP